MKLNYKIMILFSFIIIFLFGVSYAWLNFIYSSTIGSFTLGDVDISVFINDVEVIDHDEIIIDGLNGLYEAPVVFSDSKDNTFDEVVQRFDFKVENTSNVSIKLNVEHSITSNNSGITYVILPKLDESITSYKDFIISQIRLVTEDEDETSVLLKKYEMQSYLQETLKLVSFNTINSLVKDKEFLPTDSLLAEFTLLSWCEFYVDVDGEKIAPTLVEGVNIIADTITIKVEGLQYAFME